MRMIPVLDIMRGGVVRGVAGQRDQYRPIDSRLVEGAGVLDVAQAIRQRFDLDQLYVADLDAIAGRPMNVAALRELATAGFRLDVDAGLGDAASAQALLDLGVGRVIAGLETSDGPDHVRRLLTQCTAERLVFSLDLRAGRPFTQHAGWQTAEPIDIAEQVIDLGVQSLIVLDLTSVGTGKGIPTLELCAELKQRHPTLEIITGGGVRSRADVQSAATIDIGGLLVSTALHDGELMRGDL